MSTVAPIVDHVSDLWPAEGAPDDTLAQLVLASQVSILPEDIARAVLHFASERRSGKSTGSLLNVDGRVPAAYAR